MARLLVRNLEDDVKERLKARARRHGMSLEELARDVLRAAAIDPDEERKLGSEIAALFRGKGLEDDIPEWHGHPIQPARFDE